MDIARAGSPQAAFDRLMDGHRRFLSGGSLHGEGLSSARRAAVGDRQQPFATVLTCSDSRVPPEHIFDAGIGELFVCRNAGNLADRLMLGSIEYAAAQTGCPLVVVMGHSACGAVSAAVAAATVGGPSESPWIDDIVRRLAPAVSATAAGRTRPAADWIDAAARWSVERSCSQLVERSGALDAAVAAGTVGLVGLWYDIVVGEIEVVAGTARGLGDTPLSR